MNRPSSDPLTYTPRPIKKKQQPCKATIALLIKIDTPYDSASSSLSPRYNESKEALSQRVTISILLLAHTPPPLILRLTMLKRLICNLATGRSSYFVPLCACSARGLERFTRLGCEDRVYRRVALGEKSGEIEEEEDDFSLVF